MLQKKVAVAMSGGVDSGTAAASLVKQGYQVTGFYLHLWTESQSKDFISSKCCSTESLEAVRKTAALLGIPFHTLNFADLFKEKVVDYFLEEFSRGQTPNPCIACNKYIKFGRLLDYVLGLGFDFLATGHYSRIATEFKIQNSKFKIQKAKLYHLLQGVDKRKDQSYFLYNLTQKRLAHLLFPVGDYTKKEVREMAQKWKLPVAQRPESQEICFFPESDYRPFLKRHIKAKIKPGEVVDMKGRVVGEHDGLPLYTIGQRHGFRVESGIRNPASAKASAGGQESGIILPLYVVGMDVKKNQLIVGWGKEAERGKFEVEQVNWVIPDVFKAGKLRAQVRIRHQGELYSCQLRWQNRKVKVALDEPVRAITPGQSAVFYLPREALAKWGCGEDVLGGGIIK